VHPWRLALALGAAGRTKSDQTGGDRLQVGCSHLLPGGFVRGRNEVAGGGTIFNNC